MGKQTVRDFILGGSKITVHGDCSREIKRCLLLERKAMTNLDSILKSTDINLVTKVRLVKAMVFPVIMYSCESWTIKKAECWRIDALELWCWRRLLGIPWAARKSNQSILKEISPEYSLEGLMLKLKLQYFGHLMRRTDSFEKTLMLGKIEGRRRRKWQRMSWMASLTQWTWVWASSGSWWWTGKPGLLQSTGLQRVGHDWATELNWTPGGAVVKNLPANAGDTTVQFSSVAQSCPTLRDPMNCSTPGLPVHHQLPEFIQTHVHRVSDAIQPSHPLSAPSAPAPNPSQHQSLFQWVNSSHEVAKILEFQLQHHSLQRNPRADLLQNGLVGSPWSPRDSQESSPTPQFKSINSSVLSLLHSPTLTSIHDHRKNHSLD